tara:strand:- start:1561 stop:1764 length:204 start_codon:yes stop_codon:yes gene_type:complete
MNWLTQQKRRSSRPRRGGISFEWVLIASVLVFGIVGGLGSVRNALVGEIKDLVEAIQDIRENTGPTP